MNTTTQPVSDFVSLLDNSNNIVFNMTSEEASAAIISGDAARVRKIEGQFAIVEKVGQHVYMARSIGRPMRYFLAKQVSGPLLIVAERIDEIYNYLKTYPVSPYLYKDNARTLCCAVRSSRLPGS